MWVAHPITTSRRICDESRMKSFLRNVVMVLSVFVLLAACVTIPADGEAVQCAACDALWIRLLPVSGAPGIYRANHAKRWQACAACEEFSLAYFAGGRLPERCLECGGKLSAQGVEVTKSGGALLSEAGSL